MSHTNSFGHARAGQPSMTDFQIEKERQAAAAKQANVPVLARATFSLGLIPLGRQHTAAAKRGQHAQVIVRQPPERLPGFDKLGKHVVGLHQLQAVHAPGG